MRFLIVDDRQEVREAIRELLETRGHVVVAEAGTGAEALAATAQFRPDAALVDVRLGGESGLDVTRDLTNAWPDLPVLLVSVDSSTSFEHARACGARAFIAKERLHTVDLAALLQD